MTPTQEQIEDALAAFALASGLGIFPDEENDEEWREDLVNGMRAAIAAARPFIRNEALEEAAKVADDLGYECEGCGHLCWNPETDLETIQKAGGFACCPERKMRPLGAAIRAMKGV